MKVLVVFVLMSLSVRRGEGCYKLVFLHIDDVS